MEIMGSILDHHTKNGVNLAGTFFTHYNFPFTPPLGSLSQVALLLLADRFWKKVQLQWPHVLGKENPFNPRIEQVFGDQGGH